MEDESKAEEFIEFPSLLDKKDFCKDESVALIKQPAGGTSRQHPESSSLTGTQNEPLKEERIDVGVDPMGSPLFPSCFTRIFEVVTRGDHEAPSDLSTNCTTEVYSNNSKGNTALHCAVASACCKGDSDDSFYRRIDLLMNCQQMKVNMPNKDGYTALGLAIENLDKKCVERMLKHPSANRLHLDYYPGDREHTVREIIMDTYPDLEPYLPAPLVDSSDGDNQLFAALQRDEYNTFSETIDPRNPNPWYDEPFHSSLLEIACQKKNSTQFVILLLDKGADPNIKNRVTGMPLLHATARSGNFEVLQLLLEKEGIEKSIKDNEKRTILHWLAGVSEGKPGDKKKIEKCFNLLLESNYIRKKDIDDRDSSGNTALYITVEKGFRERAKPLLGKGADVRVFEHGSKILLSDSLSIVKEFLEDCLQINNKPLTSKDLQLKLNYQSLMNIVPSIAGSGKHRDLLTHPVMSTFLSIKWKNVRFIFYPYMVFYFIFLCFLTAYLLCSEPYNTLNDTRPVRNATGPLSFNVSNITSGMNDSNIISQLNDNGVFYLWLFMMVLFSFLILCEVILLIVHKWVYVESLENWLELLFIIATFISCSGVGGSAVVKRHFSAIALLLGWFEMLLMSGRLPALSVQSEMLRTVSWTFLRFMLSYVTLFIAFALSFYILFKGSLEQETVNPVFTLLKTVVMFTGEFEASALPFDNVPFTSHVIFLLFVVVVAIVLLNLLNGLAVNDTGEIKRDAERLSLAARAKLISRIEGLVDVLPECMKPAVELKEEMFVIYPNQRNGIGSAAVRSLINIISKKKEPSEKDKPTGLQEDLNLFKEMLSNLQILQGKLQEKLDSMLDESR